MIKVSIGLLEKQPVRLEGDEPKEILEIPDSELLRVTAPVHYELDCKLISGGVRAAGKVSTAICGSCGRCLAEVGREVVKEDLDLFFELPDGDELDLTEDVRAELLLELPMLLLCSEECRGLCPSCGANLNETGCSCGGAAAAAGSPWDSLDKLGLKD